MFFKVLHTIYALFSSVSFTFVEKILCKYFNLYEKQETGVMPCSFDFNSLIKTLI